MKTVVNGCGIYYIDEGDPKGLPVVFIHGMLFDHRTWRPQIDAIRGRFRVIAFDARGHGKSDTGDCQYTHRMFAEDLAALLDHLRIERAVLCGLSMGGAVALRTFELFRERVLGLVLCDTHSASDSNEAKHRRELAIREIKSNGLELFTEGFLRTVFRPAFFSTGPEIVEAVRATILATSPLAACGVLLAQAARTDTTPVLSEIGIPTLLLAGEEDILTPPSIMHSMHLKIPGSQFRIIPEAGHASNLEKPSDFNKYLLELLDNIF
ncbi:MAG TPA: alpha/beta fold hydrolase [Geobacteraceae bacterium]|nr:alpha/beta fold hydrolase [Geobacteraceae bacterium]